MQEKIEAVVIVAGKPSGDMSGTMRVKFGSGGALCSEARRAMEMMR